VTSWRNFTIAASGGLKPAPANRLRGTFPHLFYVEKQVFFENDVLLVFVFSKLIPLSGRPPVFWQVVIHVEGKFDHVWLSPFFLRGVAGEPPLDSRAKPIFKSIFY
jgi:hypothetical protein